MPPRFQDDKYIERQAAKRPVYAVLAPDFGFELFLMRN
jgi:hypothetical protein